MRESLHTRVLIWVKTILNHVGTRAILPNYEGSCMVYRPEWYENTNTVYNPFPTGIKKCKILIIDAQMVSKIDDNSPTLL